MRIRKKKEGKREEVGERGRNGEKFEARVRKRISLVIHRPTLNVPEKFLFADDSPTQPESDDLIHM